MYWNCVHVDNDMRHDWYFSEWDRIRASIRCSLGGVDGVMNGSSAAGTLQLLLGITANGSSDSSQASKLIRSRAR